MTKAVPWFKDAANVVIAGKSRPMSKDYGQVSDVIRTTTSAVLARTKTPAEGVAEIEVAPGARDALARRRHGRRLSPRHVQGTTDVRPLP